MKKSRQVVFSVWDFVLHPLHRRFFTSHRYRAPDADDLNPTAEKLSSLVLRPSSRLTDMTLFISFYIRFDRHAQQFPCLTLSPFPSPEVEANLDFPDDTAEYSVSRSSFGHRPSISADPTPSVLRSESEEATSQRLRKHKKKKKKKTRKHPKEATEEKSSSERRETFLHSRSSSVLSRSSFAVPAQEVHLADLPDPSLFDPEPTRPSVPKKRSKPKKSRTPPPDSPVESPVAASSVSSMPDSDEDDIELGAQDLTALEEGYF